MKSPIRKLCFLASSLALSFAGCLGSSGITATLNGDAELSGTLPVNPLQWRMITANIDEQTSVMATVYGNDIAVEYARTHTEQDYPAGAILAVVTWTQREDPRWFGAEIPGRATSVEFVRVTATADGRRGLSYEKYEGTPLRLVPAQNPADVDARTKFVLSQRAAVLP